MIVGRLECLVHALGRLQQPWEFAVDRNDETRGLGDIEALCPEPCLGKAND